jgi:hypothetical protein
MNFEHKYKTSKEFRAVSLDLPIPTIL